MLRIAMIGTGYVGLVTGTVFAANGHNVACVDIDEEKIARLNDGEIPIFEPGLKELVQQARADGTLSFTTDTEQAVKDSDVSFIAVGTPSKDSGAFDIVYIRSAAEAIGKALRGRTRHHTVVVKSTVDVDMFKEVKDTVMAQLDDAAREHVDIASNPEFMAEGTAVRDFSKPNRVIVGTCSERTKELMADLYESLIKMDPDRLMFMSPESAIVTKLASNGALALKVAYINEVAEYCDSVGADVEQVRMGMSKDPRIGQHFLYAGPGYGGSCFPKDIRALTANAKEKGLRLRIIGSVESSNEGHKLYLPGKIEKHLGSLQGKTFAVWGLAFKARTDDIRESPSIDVIEFLLEKGASVQVHDPEAMDNAKGVFGDRIMYCESKYEALQGADALVIVTEWDMYKNPDYSELAKLKDRVVFDGRNILDIEQLQEKGITYMGVGRNGAKKDL